MKTALVLLMTALPLSLAAAEDAPNEQLELARSIEAIGALLGSGALQISNDDVRRLACQLRGAHHLCPEQPEVAPAAGPRPNSSS